MARKILGIDPGSRHTGYAVLTIEGTRYSSDVFGVLRMDKMESQTDRLQYIFEEVTAIIKDQQPDECAVETPIYGVDPLAMLKLGRAQAAAILAITNQKLPVEEYYPKAVKKAITGNGNASKKQVAFMLKRMMNLPEEKIGNDATDALAVAWCHHTKSGLSTPATGKKPSHQNNRKSSWAAFVQDNPDRIKKH
ncbi:crossover junction endodeoxyribonuclease RuvC [Rhodohalobacter sp. SW132]|uniref:crossover junction endodeoxyribonuclease RuvC n=1 Tax=Rhodohalobacter sp. SW132 TaxID=2293433 RepID=UPI000E257A82|nr:crossover junction endodeoxyribonuclease RuvC [Rhodohalobacter sp. SW132]REL39162.1 crossover junction endodeoxyribonuclease RuvC [Rhodohalobacter sp. SW132]